MFTEAGLTPNIKQGSPGALLPMLDVKQADIVLELEPNVSMAAKNGARVVYSLADIYGDFAITGVTTDEKTIINNPDLVQRFVNAIQKAEKYIHQYPDSAALYAIKRFPELDKDVVFAAMQRVIETNTIPQDAVIGEEAWEKAIVLRQQVGEISSLEIANPVLDMSFVNKAVQIVK